MIGARALTRLGLLSCLHRVDLALGEGTLTAAELRIALRLVNPAVTGLDDVSVEQLSAMLIETLKSVAPAEWTAAETLLRRTADDPLTAVRAYKLMKKNKSLRQRYRTRKTFPGNQMGFCRGLR